VLTNLELELLLSKGPLRVPSTGRPPQSVAFVQCVGSRDVGSSPYCSGYCCKSTYKEAQAIRAQAPSCKISLFYMDWRLFDPRENVRAWASGQEGVELLRSRPAQVTPAGDGRPEVRFASEGDATVESRAFDLVVLALGLRPAPGSAQLASRLGIELDPAGFMRGLPHDPCASTRPGVFLAGSCRQPGDILACAQEGATAATRALALLEGRR
jgi:heterodisulfide reductase subunit A